jgi:hypothetical protein
MRLQHRREVLRDLCLCHMQFRHTSNHTHFSSSLRNFTFPNQSDHALTNNHNSHKIKENSAGIAIELWTKGVRSG